MDPKKNKVLTKLRDKTKPLFNVKMGKKAKKTALRYRRSISVPDLLSAQSMSSFLEPAVQSSFPDPFVGPVHSFGLDETKSETASLSESLASTDTALSAPCPDLYNVPSTPFSKRILGQNNATDTDQSTVPHTPYSAKVLDNFLFPNTPIVVGPTSERSEFLTVSATKDKAEKRMEDKERNTKWYTEDSESPCSSPFEDRSFFWPPEPDLTDLEPVSPRSTEMFIIGSAEDKNEVSWFIIFKGFFAFAQFMFMTIKSSRSQVSNETNDYDTNFLGKEARVSTEQSIFVLYQSCFTEG